MAEPQSASLGRLLRGLVLYGVGGVMNRALTVLLFPILTTYLKPADYGISAILDVLSACLVAVFSLGFGTSLTLSYYEEDTAPARDRTVSTAWIVLAASSVLLLAGGLAAAPGLSRQLLDTPGHAYLVKLSLLSTVFGMLALPFSLRLQFQERPRLLVGLTLAGSLLTAGLGILGVVVAGRGVTGLLEGRLVGQAMSFLLLAATFPARRLIAVRGRVAYDLVRRGLPMVPSFASLFLLQQGNRWFLSRFEDIETVGIYTVGTQLGATVGLAVTAFGNAWTPYFMAFQGRPLEGARSISRVLTGYVLGFGALGLLVYAAARPALSLLAAESYRDGFRFAGPAATAQILMGLFSILLPPSWLAKEIYVTSLVQAAAAILAVAFNLLLIPAFGASGAGVALWLGPAAMCLLLGLWNRSREGYLRIHVAWGRLLVFAGYYATLSTALVWDRHLGLEAELSLAIASTLLTAFVAWRLLPPAERVTLLGRFRG